MITPIITVPADVQGLVQGIGQAIKANPDRMQKGFKQAGVVAFRFAQEMFNDRSNRRGPWKELSPVTVLLRRRGSGGKIKDEADLNAKRKKVQILVDTRIGQRSLSPSHGILRAYPEGVVFGTPHGYMAKQHTGGTEQFKFDKEKKDRFFKNVKVLIPNPRKKEQRNFNKEIQGVIRKGTLSKLERQLAKDFGADKNKWRGDQLSKSELKVLRAMKRQGVAKVKRLKSMIWSPFAWDMWRMLKGMDGKTYRIPPRPIFEFANLSDEHMQRIAAPLIKAVDDSLERKYGR